MKGQEYIKDVIEYLYENFLIHPRDSDLLCESVDKADKYDKYCWHDLRKNPEDLPELLNDVLVCTKDSFGNLEYVVASKHDGKIVDNHIVFNGWTCLGIPIAWREIEPFEEVE